MSYKICIPSYSRENILVSHTLTTLQENSILTKHIYIFVVKEQYESYKNAIKKATGGGDQYHIIIGVKGLVNQRNFIENYFTEGDHLIFMDDDIKQIDLSLSNFSTLQDFFVSAFQECIKHNSFIFAPYPVFNSFYRETKEPLSTCLKFIIGAFYGIINRPNDFDLKITDFTDGDEKEDTFRTLLYFIKDGSVLRFNRVGFKTFYYGKDGGGMGKLQERRENANLACEILDFHFYEYGSSYIRKTKTIAEFNLFKLNSFNPDKSISLLPKIDDNLIDNLYNDLQKITIKKLGKSNTRLNMTPDNRSICFGMVRQRFTGKVCLGLFSKKFPHIWNQIQLIGNQFVDFSYNSVYLNHNVVCPPHKDKNNNGMSILLSFGDYTGCNIVINGDKYDANRQPIMFNGSLLEHYNTDDLVGNKYSLVFFK